MLIPGRMDTYIYTAESLSCAPGTVTTLLIGWLYSNIKLKANSWSLLIKLVWVVTRNLHFDWPSRWLWHQSSSTDHIWRNWLRGLFWPPSPYPFPKGERQGFELSTWILRSQEPYTVTCHPVGTVDNCFCVPHLLIAGGRHTFPVRQTLPGKRALMTR